MAEVTKGTRVRVVKGRKNKGAVGTVFWTGPDKFNEGGIRLGMHADDGETVWVQGDYVEIVASKDPAFAPPAPPEPPDKGSLVFFERDGARIGGTVFWVGESRQGGFRVGVRVDGEDEATWLDARQLVDAPTSQDAPESDEPSWSSDAWSSADTSPSAPPESGESLFDGPTFEEFAPTEEEDDDVPF